MNYNGMTREEFLRTFGPDQIHMFKPVPKTPTFVMEDNVNNKAQYALKTTPYEPMNCRQRTKRRNQLLINRHNNVIVPKKVIEIKPVVQPTVNHTNAIISLLQGLKHYISSYSNNFSIIINNTDLKQYDTYKELCDTICFTVSSDHSNILQQVSKIKNSIFSIFLNALVPDNFDTTSFNHTAYKSGIISNCSTYDDFSEIPSEAPYNLNNNAISNLSTVNNFIIVKDYSKFNTKARFLLSAKNLQYDLIIIEPYYNKGHYFTSSDIQFMKYKKGNKLNRRLVYAYLDIQHIPVQSKFYNEEFMEQDDTVKYWSDEWKDTLYGKNEGSIIEYFMKIGYDGVFIDSIKE
jgi:hypothetical protein